MSAKAQPGADTREREPAIVTEFRERLLRRYPECDTVDAALAKAEQEASTTVASERVYCPTCGSVKVSEKVGYDIRQRKDADFVCQHCRTHFNAGVEQDTLEEWL